MGDYIHVYNNDQGDSVWGNFVRIPDHPSIQAIKANISSAESEFHFKPVDEANITGYLGRVGLGKATRLDTIS